MGDPQAEGSPFAHGNRCDLGILVAVVVERAETRKRSRRASPPKCASAMKRVCRSGRKWLPAGWREVLAATRGVGYFTGTEGAHNRAIVRDCWASALPTNGIHSRLRVKKSTASMSHRVGEIA